MTKGTDYTWPECLNKCGNKSFHKTGICKECRASTCKKCKKRYTARSLDAKICETCAGKNKKSSKKLYLGDDSSPDLSLGK